MELNIVYELAEAEAARRAGGRWGADLVMASFIEAVKGAEADDPWLRDHPSEVAWIKAGVQQAGLSALAYAMQTEGERATAVARDWVLALLCETVPGCDAERLLYLASSASLLSTSCSRASSVCTPPTCRVDADRTSK